MTDHVPAADVEIVSAGGLVKLDDHERYNTIVARANGLLAGISNAPEARQVMEDAETARVIADRLRLGGEAVNYATAIKLKAEVLLADVLDRERAQGLRRTPSDGLSLKGSAPPTPLRTYAGDGITKHVARDARIMRTVGETLDDAHREIDRQMSAANDAGRVFSRERLLDRLRLRRSKEDAVRLAAQPVALPTGRYAVIEIDPPWDYADVDIRPNGHHRQPSGHYPALALADLRALPVPALAGPDCQLYLWITNNLLPEGFDLLEQWGFTYRTILTWCKSRIGLGGSFRNSTEHVLYAVVGKPLFLRHDIGTWHAWDAPRSHSAKPDGFYAMVETLSPGPYVRLFARGARDGWVSWGNEVMPDGD